LKVERRGKRKKAEESRLGERVADLRKQASLLWADIARSSLPRIFGAFAAVVLLSALVVWLIERTPGEGMFHSLFDGIWWAVVTLATVGYGDKYPITVGGRVAGIIAILSGIVITSLISGTVASIFVERRIREGKGLQDLRLKNHLIVCGWNPNAESILADLASMEDSKGIPVVLVDFMESEDFDAEKARFPALDLRFVRGDFTQETVLKRASANTARSCVVVPDSTGGNSLTNADERTILCCLAIRSLNPDMDVSAEILHPESEQHLERAKVDNIVIGGEYSGYLLSSASVSKGLPRAARRLLSAGQGPRLRESALPSSLVGKTFAEASAWFLSNGKGVLVGVLSEEKGVSLHELLGDDTNAIDSFIKRKFMEAEINLAAETSAGSEVRLAPGPDYKLKEGDLAFVVA
jgi:Kef-type K+ transport systems, predicted NAD-binding component